MTCREWLDVCKAKGEKPIPEEDPLFAYADRVGINITLLQLHWDEFKLRMTDSGKRRRDWLQTMRDSVRGNWYRLWWMPPGREAELTTAGRQAMAFHESSARWPSARLGSVGPPESSEHGCETSAKSR